MGKLAEKIKPTPSKKSTPVKSSVKPRVKSAKIDKVVEVELAEIISNLELLNPIEKTWLEKSRPLWGQFILSVLVIATTGFLLWSINVVPPNARLFGINIGGKIAPTAYELVNIAIQDQLEDPIRLKTPQGIVSATPEQLGVSLDLPKTIKNIHKNPISFISSALYPATVTAKIDINDNSLKISLAKIAQANTAAPINATLKTQGGRVVTTDAKSGTEIDWEETKKSIRDSWLYPERDVVVAITFVPPNVSDEDVNKIRSDLAEQAIAAPITLTMGQKSVVLSPAIIGEALSFVPTGEKIESRFSEEIIKKEIARQLPNISPNSSDAYFDFKNNKIILVPAQEGLRFISGQLDAALSPVFRKKGERKVSLDSAVVKPVISTESLEKLKITDQLSNFRQAFDYLPYREKNVGQAAKYLDGKLLAPGEVFSMNETIKERTTANGYVKGIYIGDGGRFAQGLGGGVSIITSATWSAAFFAGLEKIEQRAHSVHIERYTPGLEATVSWPTLDLKFRNNTGNYVLIKAFAQRDGIAISMYGTKVYDKISAVSGEPFSINNNIGTFVSNDPNCVPQPPGPGYKIKVQRLFWKNNQVVETEDFLTSYKPSTNVICQAIPEIKPEGSTPDQANPEATLVP